jgi:Lrp/AsnC family transcriptional regulator, leucine-responsive regulatory protein
MANLDEKDCMILNILQINCRTPLTKIAKTVGLSIDSVNKRIKRMLRDNIFHPKIQIRPRNIGYANIVDVKIRLQYSSEKEVREFISYLEAHPRVSEVFSTSGDWDFSIVIIAQNALDLGNITSEIRYKFGKMITSWTETLTTNSHKFEYYDMCKLMGFPSSRVKLNFDLIYQKKE